MYRAQTYKKLVFFHLVQQMTGESLCIGHNRPLQISFSPAIHNYNHHILGAHIRGGGICRAAIPQIKIKKNRYL